MKRVVAIALVLAVLGWTVPAQALIGTVDQVPAATLLQPYFEVDLDNPNGINTLLSINNASATALLAHVVFWSDLSVPTLTFNIYLTGYDVQTISLRDIFVNGVLPRTASDGQDPQDSANPNDGISNQGLFSQDINFASCSGQLPYPTLQQIFQTTGFDYLTHLQLAHTGQASPILANRCAGRDLNDRIARGYITVDTVNNCTLRFPGDAGYFPAGGGDVTSQNVLWGDYFYVNPEQNFAQGDTLVHIEAAPGIGTSGTWGTYGADPETTTPGQYTFYGRYVAWTASDNREPLATSFATRFLNGGVFDGGTSLVVWRDSKVNQGAFTCPAVPNLRPAWFPLGQEGLVTFDEQENPDVTPSFPIAPQPPNVAPIPFPAEAQRTQVGGPDFPVPFTFGWIYLNLNQSSAVAGANPPEDPLAAQAWVTSLHDAEGRFSVGYSATQLDSAAQALHFTPGP